MAIFSWINNFKFYWRYVVWTTIHQQWLLLTNWFVWCRFFSPCGRGANDSVGPRDRYKFCGSLPNHLDNKEDRESEDSAPYRDNNNVRAPKSDLVLRLQPLVPSEPALQDKLRLLPVVPQDQGYASERSPEDELPPALPPPHTANQLTCPVHHPHAKPVYPFLHKSE